MAADFVLSLLPDAPTEADATALTWRFAKWKRLWNSWRATVELDCRLARLALTVKDGPILDELPLGSKAPCLGAAAALLRPRAAKWILERLVAGEDLNVHELLYMKRQKRQTDVFHDVLLLRTDPCVRARLFRGPWRPVLKHP